MDTLKLSYVAGYIDGDGCFYVRTYFQKPKNILVFDYSIQVCSVDEDTIKYFNKEFGGSFTERVEKRKNRKPSFLWTIKTKQSLGVASRCFEFLIIKRRSCELFLSLGDSIKPNCGVSLCENAVSERRKILERIKQEIHMHDFVDKENFKTLKTLIKGIEPSEEDLAYFSGLIDAEGCFRIGQFQSKRSNRNRSYISILEIGNTKFPIFPWLIQRFGGTVVYRNPTSRRRNPMIIWSLKSKALHQILDKIYPFLRFKKKRCEKLMELRNTGLPNGGNRKSEEFKIRQSEIQADRERIAEDLHKLNAKGRH